MNDVQALAAKEAAEKQAASLKALLKSPEGAGAKQPVMPEVSGGSGERERSYKEAAVQTDRAGAVHDDNSAQQQGTETRDERAGASEAPAEGTHIGGTLQNGEQVDLITYTHQK